MPWQQPWIDPNTGATCPQSYVRLTDAQVDFPSRQFNLTYARWAGADCYSLGLHPIQTSQVQIAGSAFLGALDGAARAAEAQRLLAFRGMAASYVSGLSEFSGAQVVP